MDTAESYMRRADLNGPVARVNYFAELDDLSQG